MPVNLMGMSSSQKKGQNVILPKFYTYVNLYKFHLLRKLNLRFTLMKSEIKI